MTNKNLFNYKAQRFQSELNKTTFAYEVKRVRALWDPTLSIPGTNRRGGWRCPVGTRYGGQITDRFGRNCGWGVARRIANAITNIGERLESVDDRRRGRRVDRRNRRMMGRLQRNADAGRAERGLRGIADVLDGGEGSSNVPRTPRGRDVILDDVDVPERSPEVLDDVDAPEPSPVVLDDGGRPLDGRAARRAERKRRRQERRERREREAREREARGEPPPGQLGRGWRGLLDPDDPRYNEQGNRPWFGPPQNAPRADADEVDAPGGRRPGGRRRPDAPEADTRPRTPTDEDGGDAPGMPPRPARPRRPKPEDGGAGDDDGTPDATPATPPRRPRRPRPPRDEEARPRPGERKPPRVPAAEGGALDDFITPDGAPNRDGNEPNEIVIGRDGKPYKWVPNPDANAIGRGRQEKGSWVPASNVDLENDRLSKKRRRVRGDDFRNPKSPKGAPDPEGKTRIWTDDEGDQWEYDPNRREWDLRGNPDKRREAEEKDRKERGGAAGAPQPPNRPPFDSDERDAGLRESERRRVRREIEEPGAPRTETGEQPEAEAPKPKRPRRKQNRRRAASDEVATESATRRPPAPGDKPAGGQKKPSDRVNTEQEVLELEDIIQMLEGGSEPDSRSFRNVNNRFPKSGLPKSAFWRKPDYDGDDAEQLERRFSRYYDADGNINARGRVVNREIARRKREGGLTPKGRKPRKPKAEKKPKGPVSNTPADQADIPSPPPMAATEDIPEYQRLPEEYKQQARKVYEDALKDGDRRRKVQDDEVDKLIAKPEGTQKRLKLEQARDDAEMLEKVYRQSREEAEQNMRNMENVPFNEMSEGMKRTYIDYVAGAMRSRKEEEYARRRRMRIVNALGEDARNQPPDRPAPKPRDVRPPNRAPSQPSSSTATEENNPKFKELPEEAKQKARELFQTIVKARNDRNDREDIFVDNAIGRPAGAEANQILKDVLRREKEDLDRVLDEKYDARDNIAKLERDHGSYSEMSPTQQQNYIDSVAVIMRAEKDADRRKKRISKLKSAINEREAAPAPRPAGRPVPENRSDVRPRQQPNIGPQKVKADNDNKLGQYEGGLPAGKAVPIGNKGINTKEDAATFLRNGGEVRDVPDDFILFAMMRNTEGPNPRYRLSSVGGGGNVNGALRMFVDEEREKMFIIKYADGRSYAQNEDIYEILGNNIAGRMGLPVSEFRFAGPVVPNNKPGVSGHIRPVLFEHSGNLVEGTLQAARINHVEKIEPEDVIAATLLDYAVLNTDRHGGNYFLVTQNGKMHFVQIDMSLGFHAREFDPGDDFSGDGGFLTWLKSGAGGRRNDMAQMLPERVRQGRVTRAEVVRAIIKIQENLRAAEQAKRYTEFGQDVYNARGEVAKIDQGVKYVDARLKYLMEVDPNRLADIILERAI